MIWQAVGLQSPSPRRCFDAHWVCDIDPRCGHVLRGHAAERSIASTVSPTLATRVIGRFAGRFSSMGCFVEAARPCVGKVAAAQALW